MSQTAGVVICIVLSVLLVAVIVFNLVKLVSKIKRRKHDPKSPDARSDKGKEENDDRY